ncbi:phosphorylated adapter RNA export protein [Hemiscyllium ocellatum]|uniref:phosphorylated adapter RNA export protein n=1 Tax=Hemiscyllium ocellatum TaxID=170820 RepID=UPI002966C34C|nr:phosphorylated adapter RNA export protein [Hemiscyllium ocellatum]
MAAPLEDGEVLDSESDSEMTTGGEPQNQQAAIPNFPTTPFNAQNDVPAHPSSFDLSSRYRTATSDNSSEESDLDSDDEERLLWRRKRQKCSNSANNLPLKPPGMPFGPVGDGFMGTGNPAKVQGRKVNNIWGSVLQEQNQDAVATELGILGMEGCIDMNSRQSETYNYAMAKKMMAKQRREEDEEMNKLEAELDEYIQDGRKIKNQEECNQSNLKRKRPVKERLGERLEMNYKGKCDIKEDDSPNKISDEIAYRLREPKTDLIHRVVKTIGRKKAIELLIQTAEVEQNGGLMIVDGSRRRTPGGVYLQLLKNTPSITQDQIKEIFYDENQREYNCKKAAKKRRRHIIGKKMKQAIKELNLQVDDDASRETFASDTNDALASVEDTEEVHMEKPPLDPEDAIELDNSNDLEIF